MHMEDGVKLDKMSVNAVLEYLCDQSGCYFSDLRYSFDNYRLVRLLLELGNDKIDVGSWNYALSYIYNDNFCFKTVEEAKKRLQHRA